MTYEERFLAAEKANQTADIVPDIIEWTEPNQTLYGELLSIDTAESNDREFNCYTFAGDTKMFRLTLGVKYDRLVTDECIGRLLKITYLGKHKLKNGNQANEFDIRIANDAPKSSSKGK